MAILNVPITNATCTRAELEAARLLNGLVAARIYYISNEQIYELATGPNTTIQYLPTTSTPGDIGAEPAITPKGTAFNQDFGVGSGDVCEGDDARLHDDRDPTLHAASHAQGGLDELTPAAIGAATAADVAGKVAKAGDTMTGDLNLISAKVLITDGGVRSVHSPFDYNDPSTGVGGFGLEDAGDASTTGGMVLMTNPATGTEEVTVGSVDGSTGLRLRAPHVVVDSQSVAVALEAAEAGSSIIVTGFTQTGEAILGAVQPPGTAYEETQIDTRNLSLGTGDGTGAWVDVVVLDALTQECQDNLTQIIYQMYMANSSTAETKVEVGYRIDGADPAEWRLHDLGTSSSGVSISDVFQPPSNLLLGQVLTLTARRVGTHADSTALIQGAAIDASSFKVRVIQAAVSTGEANRGFALASPNVYYDMDGFNLRFRGMADTGDIEWSTPSADTLGADLTTQAGVTPGTYTYPTIQVDAKGRVVTISNQIGGGLDHGALGGLVDDDHTQYHNDSRGDARYAPLIHAVRHATGGADALTASAIGAEPEIGNKGTAFNKDFGAIAGTVCDGDDARLALAGSALQSVEDDTDPTLGGNLKVGGSQVTAIELKDSADSTLGFIGVSAQDDDIVVAKTSPDGLYDPSDGGILIESGGTQLYGANVGVKTLAHTDPTGYHEVHATTDGHLYGVSPPAPSWTVADTSTDDNDLVTNDVWVQLTGLNIVVPQDIAIGDLIEATIKIYFINGNKDAVVAIGIGVNSLEPIADSASASVIQSYSGRINFGITVVMTEAIASGDRLRVWAKRTTGTVTLTSSGSTQANELIVNAPSPSSGGGGGDPTNITIDQSGAANIVVESDTGTNGTILPATSTEAGGMSAADKAKLDALGSPLPARVAVALSGTDTWSPDLLDGDAYVLNIATGATITLAPVSSGDDAANEYTCSFEVNFAGTGTININAGVMQMNTFGAITDADGETTGILRSRADGVIELYRASEVTS